MKYYGQFNPQVDQVLHERYFQNKFNRISIEAGAFDGITDSCTKFFEDNYNWKTINIEPLPDIFSSLQLNRPNSINLEIALSNFENISVFKNYKHPSLGYNWGNGSINHTIEHTQQLKTLCGENNYIEIPVQCKTYRQIINELNIEHLDLFVLDVEGNEFSVIEGMVGCNILPDIFVIEHGHTKTDIISDKLQVLNNKYKLDYISFVNSFYIKI
jgi:FkbM family methyltransferase